MPRNLVALLLLFVAYPSFAQERDDPFSVIDEKLITLVNQDAPILAPDYYNDAVSLYNSVLEDYRAGYLVDELQEELNEINELIYYADSATLSIANHFSELLSSRKESLNIKADSVSSTIWEEAETNFKDAVEEFTDDDLEDADEYGIEADSLFKLSMLYTNRAMKITHNWAPHMQALSANANLLSPVFFNNASVYKNKALEMIDDGESLYDIEEIISTSQFLFEESKNHAVENAVACASILEARDRAQNKNAPLLAPYHYFQAEDLFRDACLQYIDRDDDFWDSAVKAENLYNEATKVSLRTYYIQKIDDAIEEAEDNDADTYAPKTLAICMALKEQTLAKIDSIADYDDQIKQLSDNAVYEAKHASYISSLVQKLEDEGRTSEEIVLASEKYIADIAREMNIKPNFEDGYSVTTNAILGVIRSGNLTFVDKTQDEEYNSNYYDDYSGTLEYDTQDNSTYNSDDNSYAGDEKEPADEGANENSSESSIESLFTRDEAEIIEESDRSIIRLTGLIFPAAITRLEEQDYPLLDKAVRAIKMFPDSEIIIEAHTDSRASRNFNLSLSQERADAILKYFQSKVGNSIEARGYGEDNPIADNSTEEGRKLNRRIEVIIVKSN